MRRERRAWLDSVDVVRSVLSLPAVRARWDDPAAVEGWTVGAVTAHLVRGVATIPGYADKEVPAGSRPVGAAEYWRRVPTDPNDPLVAEGHARSTAHARLGVDRLVAELDAAQRRVRDACTVLPK
jgi:hypothetical protein